MITTPALRTLACSILLAVPAAAVLADDALPPEDMFQRAFAVAQAHYDAAAQVCSFSYAPDWHEAGSFRFADNAGSAQRLDADAQPLDPELGRRLPEDGRRLIRMAPDRLLESQDTPRFVRWENGLAIYSFRPVSVPLSGGGFSFDIAENVVAEVGIDPETAMVAFREVTAPSSFRPNAVVRIRDYQTRVNFRPAWPDGPVVVADQRYAIVAVAMLQTHNLTGSSAYSGFTRCEAG